MSCSKWGYTPEKCDGNICPGDCDLCPKAIEDEDMPEEYDLDEPSDDNLEMGFDPYLGTYTDDC